MAATSSDGGVVGVVWRSTAGGGELVAGTEEAHHDVRDFGTVDLTGATEATTVIQAAIDAANTAGGGIVELPVGTMLCGQLTMQSNVWLRGRGIGSVLKAKSALNAPLIVATSETDLTFSDFKIDGNKANQTNDSEGAGIKLTTCDYGVIERLHIDSTEGHSIHFSSVSSTDEGWRVSDVLITNAGTTGNATYGSGFASTEAENIALSNVVVLDAAKAGFRLSGSFTLNGCVAKRCGNGGIVGVSGELAGLTVNGGHYSDNGTSSDNDGIRLLGCDRVALTGVMCEGNYGAGVHIGNGCDHVTVVGGVFRNNGQHGSAAGANEGRDGISIGGDGSAITNVTIVGATLTDTQGTATQDYGINIRDTVTGLVVAANRYAGNQTGDIRRAWTVASSDIVIDPPGAQVIDSRSAVVVRDDFLNSSTTSQTIGEQRWFLSNGTAAVQAAELHHPGIVRLSTGGSINTVAAIRLGGGVTSLIDGEQNFDLLAIVRVNQADADTTMRVGLSSDQVGNPASNGVYFERLSADTNWFGVQRSSSSQTRTDTTVAMGTGWHVLRMRRVSSTVSAFSVDGSAEVLVSATSPTSSLCGFVQIINTAAADKTVDIDLYELSASGLLR